MIARLEKVMVAGRSGPTLAGGPPEAADRRPGFEVIRAAFLAKRDLARAELEKTGVTFDAPTDGTFYAWGDLSRLPPPFNTGMGFFRKALEAKVIVVPGEFFDVNPGRRRAGKFSRFRSHARFSFGPRESDVREGLSRLAALVRR